MLALDHDSGENAIVKYEIVSETFSPTQPFHLIQFFMLNPSSGELSVSRALPAESEFLLNISASDEGLLKDHLLVKLRVKDVNDHPPVFKKSWYNFDTEEASYSRKILGRIEAMDADHGANANVSYWIKAQNSSGVPFSIGVSSGVLSVNGVLDREVKDQHSFVVIAKDNPLEGAALSSSVNVEVNVLDINDNPPVFYGFDESVSNQEANVYANHFYQEKIPVYYATASENSPIGTNTFLNEFGMNKLTFPGSPITRVFANDSDFSGNGNGLILFDIPFRKGRASLFSIDSKEGIVTTLGKLDYETARVHNVTIVASDLGSPSLSSTALLMGKLNLPFPHVQGVP